MIRDTGKRNRGRFVISTVMCVYGEPIKEDELRDLCGSVSRVLSEGFEYDTPYLGEVQNSKYDSFSEIFHSMKDLGSVGRYVPDNAYTGDSYTGDKYVLSRFGYQFLSRPTREIEGVSHKYEEAVRVVVHNILGESFFSEQVEAEEYIKQLEN